nr:HAD hydrolase-like protein [Actinacidiphila bryophytorum]
MRTALSPATRLFGVDLTPLHAVVVGDTPADVRAGTAVGVPVIAVARRLPRDLRSAQAPKGIMRRRRAPCRPARGRPYSCFQAAAPHATLAMGPGIAAESRGCP